MKKNASKKAAPKKNAAKKSAAKKAPAKSPAKKAATKPAPKKAPAKKGPSKPAAKKSVKKAVAPKAAPKAAAKKPSASSGSNLRIEPNMFATVDYVLFDAKGKELDSSKESEIIEYVHGYGMLVPGLEAALEGMAKGEKKKVRLSPSIGFGERDESMVFKLDRAQLKGAKMDIGDQVVFEDEDGHEIELFVVKIGEKEVVVDANHPLSGQHVVYEVEVKSVRPAKVTELKKASMVFEETQEEHDAKVTEHLVTLRR